MFSRTLLLICIAVFFCAGLGWIGLFRDPHNGVALWISGTHTLLYCNIVTIHGDDSPDAEDKSRLYRRPSCEGMTVNVACPLNYSPVCGSNGVTYPNECSLCVFRLEKNADILIVAEGPC